MKWVINGTPNKAQVDADEKCNDRDRFAYFMEMGLGKTALVINEFQRLQTEGKVSRLVVVCPNLIKDVWVSQFAHWSPRLVDIQRWPDTRVRSTKPEVFVINYEAIVQRSGQSAVYDMAGRDVMLVVDESHRIKNFQSKSTKFLMQVYREFGKVRLLTGTPRTNTAMDYWPQLRLAGGISGVNPIAFRSRFCKVGGFMGKQIVGDQNVDELKALLNKCSFFAKKSEYLKDLPPKQYNSIYLDLPPALRKHYREMENDFITMINDREVVAEMAITQANKLQQISSGFVFDGDREPIRIVPMKMVPKYQALMEILEGSTSKVIVFAGFVPTCLDLYEALVEDGVKTAILSKHAKMDSAQAMRMFNEDNETRVMVAQIQTAAEGVTLLGSKDRPCYLTVFFENVFHYGLRMQAEDRNHRIGQRNAVDYYDMISSKTERRVIDNLLKKKSLIEWH